MENIKHTSTSERSIKKKITIHLMGDPIKDINHLINDSLKPIEEVTRWSTATQIVRDGGVLNVENNIDQLICNSELTTRIFCEPCYNYELSSIYEQHRIINTKDPAGSTVKEVSFGSKSHDRPRKKHYQNIEIPNPREPNQVLCVSDYNLGNVNYSEDFLQYADKLACNYYAVVIVDSKYRTVAPALIESGKFRICRSTISEYTDDWGLNFDLVFLTNGSGPVRLFSPTKKISGRFELFVPEGQVVDTVGAGDTFTAALAVYYANNLIQEQPLPNDSLDLAYKAGMYAIAACTEVVQQPFVAVPKNTKI